MVLCGLWLWFPGHAGAQAKPRWQRAIDLIGFSGNEALVAMRYDYRVPVDKRVEDRFSIAEVIDSRSGQVLGRYRLSAVGRYRQEGAQKARFISHPKHQYALYRDAHSHDAWRRLARGARFHKKAIIMNDSLVRLYGAEEASIEAKEHRMVLKAATGKSLAFEPIVRKMRGGHVSAGKFSQSPMAGQSVGAEIRGYYAASGHLLAFWVRFSQVDGEGEEPLRDRVTLLRLEDAPLGTTNLGVVRVSNESLVEGRDLFESLHPGQREAFDRYVGALW